MTKKMWMMILLSGVVSLSGCHTAQRTAVRAGYYDPYPYAVGYVDPYPRYDRGPFFYPAYFYDPYPYFFFRSDFLFFGPSRRIIITDPPRFGRPRPSLRGRRRGGGSNFNNPGFRSPVPSPAPAPGPPPKRSLR